MDHQWLTLEITVRTTLKKFFGTFEKTTAKKREPSAAHDLSLPAFNRRTTKKTALPRPRKIEGASSEAQKRAIRSGEIKGRFIAVCGFPIIIIEGQVRLWSRDLSYQILQ